MTRVCVRCGWLVFDGSRCRRDGGPSVSWQAAARACRVQGLRSLLHLEPSSRLAGLHAAVALLRQKAET